MAEDSVDGARHFAPLDVGDGDVSQCARRGARQRLDAVAVHHEQIGWVVVDHRGESVDRAGEHAVHRVAVVLVGELPYADRRLQAAHLDDGRAVLLHEVHSGDQHRDPDAGDRGSAEDERLELAEVGSGTGQEADVTLRRPVVSARHRPSATDGPREGLGQPAHR